jgi:hypothetical protein
MPALRWKKFKAYQFLVASLIGILALFLGVRAASAQEQLDACLRVGPHARAAFESSLAAYQNNRQAFQGLIASFLDVLKLDEEYWQNVAERETALARPEELTGLSSREEGAKQ